MCGIFGVVEPGRRPYRPAALFDTMERLFVLSESRGKEASGLVVGTGDSLRVMKSGLPASRMIRTAPYRALLRTAFGAGDAARSGARVERPAVLIGHSRLVTTGSQYDNRNNQPVRTEGAVGVHNGIIVNHEGLWVGCPAFTPRSEVDSEVVLALVQQHRRDGATLPGALRSAFAVIEGVASVALLFADHEALALATNNGSLYVARAEEDGAVIFASERHILEQVIARGPLERPAAAWSVRGVVAGEGLLVYPDGRAPVGFALGGEGSLPDDLEPRSSPRRIIEVEGVGGPPPPRRLLVRGVGRSGLTDTEAEEEIARVAARFPHAPERADRLRRCTRCILPETMPFITFDADGVCSYCHRHQPIRPVGLDSLREELARRKPVRGGDDTRPDCVVGMSGGRDSLYALHLVREVLGLRAVAYTYDWGMVTDLARRNSSRICAKLGVEHILVSADIVRKRENIRRNVEAWLRRPELGMIPLFMAGDKQYFHHLRAVREQTGAWLSVMGENMLERTDFKTGYAGVPPHRDPRHVYTLPRSSKLRLFAYYAGSLARNPAYLNRSLFDSAWASVCYYGMERDYLNLFAYLPWVEEEVIGTLIDGYGFELADDTVSTWRIGDGTAAFYNYIYYHVAGFTENDTFRSNQIRQGVLDRATALARVREENRPRWSTLHWYLRTIGLDRSLVEVAEVIHRMPQR